MNYEAYFLLIFAISFGYLLVCGWSAYCFYKIQLFSSEWNSSKYFYLSILLQSLTRTFTFIFMSLNFPANTFEKNLFFTLISVPDCLFLITYGLLVYRMLTIFYFCHMEKQILISILSKISKTSHRGLLKCILPILFIWIIYVSVMYFLMFYGKLSNIFIRLQISIFNIIAGAVVLYAIIFFFSKYLLIPFKSTSGRDKLLRFCKIVTVFTIGRFYKGTIGLLEVDISSSLPIDVYEIHNSSNLAAMILVSTYLISEILAFSLVLDFGFIYIFVFPEEEFLQYSGLYNIKKASESEEIMSVPSNAISERSNPVLDPADIENLKLYYSKRNGLGKVYTGSLKGEDIVYREIRFPRISGQILEKIKREIAAATHADMDCLVPVYGTVFNLPMICIISKYMPGGNLFALVHQDLPLDLATKLQTLIKVAHAIKELHIRSKFHGHLNPNNFLFDKENNLKISDFGMEKVKQYAEKVIGYSNLTPWSSIESLLDSSKSLKKPQAADDIYSFGVIAWEIFTQNKPFQGLSINEIREAYTKSFKFDVESLPSPLSSTIKRCLSRDKQKRPDIKQISNALANLK